MSYPWQQLCSDQHELSLDEKYCDDHLDYIIITERIIIFPSYL